MPDAMGKTLPLPIPMCIYVHGKWQSPTHLCHQLHPRYMHLYAQLEQQCRAGPHSAADSLSHTSHAGPTCEAGTFNLLQNLTKIISALWQQKPIYVPDSRERQNPKPFQIYSGMKLWHSQCTEFIQIYTHMRMQRKRGPKQNDAPTVKYEAESLTGIRSTNVR